MDAMLDGLEASVMRRVIRTARKRCATETTGLVLLDVLMDIRDHCVCKVGTHAMLCFYTDWVCYKLSTYLD